MASTSSDVYPGGEEEEIDRDYSGQTGSIPDYSELTPSQGLTAAQSFQKELLLRCVAPNAPVNNSPSFKVMSSSLVPTEDDLKQTCTYLAVAWGSPTRLACVIHFLLKQWSTYTVNVKVNRQDFQTALFDWAPSIANMSEEELLTACARNGDLDKTYAFDRTLYINLRSEVMGRHIKGKLEFNGKDAISESSYFSLNLEERQAIIQRMYELWATAPTQREDIRGGVHMYALSDGNKLQAMSIRRAAPLRLSAAPSQSRNYRGTLVFMRGVYDETPLKRRLTLPIPLLANLSTQLDFSIHPSLSGVSTVHGRFDFRTLLMYAATAHRLDHWHVMDSKPWGRPRERETPLIQLRLGLHFRFMAIETKFLSDISSGDCEGLSMHRETATLRQSKMGLLHVYPSEYFTEKAVYVHCNILMTPYSPYNAIVLSDDGKWSHSDFVSFKNGSAITAGRRTLGVAHFLMLIQLIYRDVEAEWQSTMNSVGRDIGVPLGDVNDKWVTWLIMNAESFDNSKKYLRLLQVFRIMGQWIVQNMRALETLREDFFREITGVGYDEAEVDLMKKNWAIVMEDAQHRTAVVQESIRMRAEEIKELQDGLFNATSLREASKGMLLNKAIYVFTVVTIIFTPIGFLATFFALPHLNNENDAGKVETPRGFTISFITIPLATYGTCTAMAYMIGSGNMDRFLKSGHWRTVFYDMKRFAVFPFEICSVAWMCIELVIGGCFRMLMERIRTQRADMSSANDGERSVSLGEVDTAV